MNSSGLVLITGGSRGIGKAIAEELAMSGYDLILLAKNSETLNKTQTEIVSKYNVKVDSIQCDLDNTVEIDRLYSICKTRNYKLDAIIHSAGIFIEGCNLESSIDVYDKTMNVDVRAIYYLTKILLPLLFGQPKPRVIIIGSTAGLEPYPIGSIYGVAKWALRGYAINLRQELMREGIGVTLVNPGSTFTDLWEGVELPSDRFVQPRDIGKLVRVSLTLEKNTVVDEIIVRPMLGDVHDQ